MRIVPLYVLFDGEPLRDQVDIGPGQFYERLAARELAADDVAADARRLPRLLRGARRRRVHAHLVAPPDLEALGHLRVGRPRRGGARPATSSGWWTRRRPRSRARCSPRRSTAARARHDGRGDRAARRALSPRERCRLHGRDARVPPEGRPHREGTGARRLAPQREADPLGRGRRDRPGRPRTRKAEGAEGVRAALHGRDGGS